MIRRIEIVLGPNHFETKVFIDGVAIENVASVAVHADAQRMRDGTLPTVHLELVAETVVIHGEADVSAESAR